MAIYHLKTMRDGSWEIWAEMRNGRDVRKTARWEAHDKNHLRQQMQNLALTVKDAREGKVQLRGAQVKRGEEKA